MISYEVPFVENTGGHCVPACVAMVVQHFMPELDYDLEKSDELCGYKEGLGTWAFKSTLELSSMGFQIDWIGDWSIQKFANDPEAYLTELFQDEEALHYQLQNSDIPLEQKRAKKYLESGLPFTQRQGTRQDIERLLDTGWLARLEVNGFPLAGEKGYGAHSVLAIGYDEKEIEIHNPDGKFGSKPNQKVEWSEFMYAWEDFGGSMELTAYCYEGSSK